MKPIQKYIGAMMRRKTDQRKKKAMMAGLAVLVAAGVAWQLRLPGIAMIQNPLCGLEEHTHGETCYTPGTEAVLSCTAESVGVHAHEDACYDAEDKLICGKADFVVHVHNPGCYGTASQLLCTFPEIREHSHTEDCYKTPETHVHGEECYEWITPETTCTIPVSEGHAHGESCYGVSETATCGQEESTGHTHGEGCHTVSETPVCGVPDSEPHTHTDACYRSLTCEITESTGHTHDPAKCFKTLTCTVAESAGHAHDDTCTPRIKTENLICTLSTEPQAPVLVCEKQEVALHTHSDEEECFEYPLVCTAGHAHTETCYGDPVLVCQKLEVLEHVHEGACMAIPDVLACTLTEHTHTESCAVDPNAPAEEEKGAEGALAFDAGDYTTTITVSADAALPADTVVTADPLFDSNEPAVAAFSLLPVEEEPDDSSAYVEAIMQAVTWGDVTRIKLFDITLTSGGEEVQPAAPVQVRTEFAEPLAMAQGEVVYGVHIGESGAEILPADTERDANGNVTAVTHTQSSFSPSGYVLVHVPNETDIGPDVLPVHYCLWINEQWIVAGSTSSGWHGSYTDPSNLTDGNRDYITLAQIGSVLDDYGLDITNHNEITSDLWYQRAEIEDITIHRARTPVQKDGQWVLPLSGNKVKDQGYMVYYVPGNTQTAAASYKNNDALAADIKQESKFYTLTVRDRQGVVYSDPADIPAAQVIPYGGVCEMTLKANGEHGWMWVNAQGVTVNGITRIMPGQTEPDPRFHYTDNGDGTETYRFGLTAEEAAAAGMQPTGILGRTTLIPFSTAVDGATPDHSKKVDVVVHRDGKWEKVGQIGMMYQQDGVCERTHDNGTVETQYFVTAGQVYAVLADYGFEPKDYHPDDATGKGHAFVHAQGAFDEKAQANGLTFCADGVNTVLNDTVAIGMGHPDSGNNFTLFYLPGSSEEGHDAVHGFNSNDYAANEELISNDQFYTITVEDDYQLVYYGYETEHFHAYVREGQSTSISVQNNPLVLWSVREPWKAEQPDKYVESPFTASSEDNYNKYTFSAVNGPLVIEASSLNPSYTVQYYTELDRYSLYEKQGDSYVSIEDGTALPAGYTALSLIDTTGKKLPKNGVTTSETTDLLYLGIRPTSSMATENAGNDTAFHEVVTYTDITKIYESETFPFETHYLWRNIDKLRNNDDYVISSISILKDGRDPNSTDKNDFWIYEAEANGANISFTNLASEEYAPRVENEKGETVPQPATEDYKILVTEGMILRIHYDRVSTSTPYDANFYDYDISNGRNADGQYRTGQKGINSMYAGKTSIPASYAFGNANCYTGMAASQWNGQEINQYNRDGDGYQGCTFGLVKSIDAYGNITWAGGITGPKIFSTNSGNVTGRTDYDGTLTFNHHGDVYTLQTASLNVGGSRTNLDKFFNPSPDTDTTHTHIFTNNFWAMDSVNSTDGRWGASGNRGKATGYENYPDTVNTRGDADNGNFPLSDDGNAHNWFFGMSFGVNFTFSKDYVGPMEYIFFGDDDMWVFLDDQLICDIGGVHSSVGEYVNLRDYLPVGSSGTHTLRFYYTERGASGSTCWMSFTLPNATSFIEEEGHTSIILAKELQNSAGEILTNGEYEFKLSFFEDESQKTPINTGLIIDIERADGSSDTFATESGTTFMVGAGEKLTISGAPVGKYYVLEEIPDEFHDVQVNNGSSLNGEPVYVAGYMVDGVVGEVNIANFRNIIKGYNLPNTGGAGTLPYIFGGLLLMAAPLKYISTPKKRERRRRP